MAFLRSKHPRLGIRLAAQEAFREGCTILSPYSPLDGHVHGFQFFTVTKDEAPAILCISAGAHS